jgi:hypothetical protein
MNEFVGPTGVNFSAQELKATELSLILCRTVSFIQAELRPRTPLQKYHDWWEHDGCHFYKGPVTLHELFDMVSSPRSLLEAMPGDDEVFIGIAPQDNLWYLRYYVFWNGEGTELYGRFDITLPCDSVDLFKEHVIQTFTVSVEEQDATSYYQKIR